MAELTISSDEIRSAIANYTSSYSPEASREEVGVVTTAADGIAQVSGMPSVMANELLEFPGGVIGVAQNLDTDQVGVVVLGNYESLREGDEVKRTGEVLSIPVGDKFLGRVINPLGEAIDGLGDIEKEEDRVLELQAPSVLMRQPVEEPMQTGIKAIDAMTPIGRGQRQLIIGDRKTGKTSVCIDTILNQRANWESGDPSKQVRCIYVAIGQKGSTIASIRKTLEENGALDYTTIVAAPASDSAGFKWLAPFAGAALGQHWMYQGKHVLVIYDDLTKQAEAYRAISLLLRRPPGREAYPGDVFYLHSRLLERAAKLSDDLGGGSLTALPIIETKANDVSAFIPTNVISITDGQVFLESDLFNQGVRPAINVGVSVSRVGGAAQTKGMKKVSGSLRLDLAAYRDLEAFAAFASDLDAASKAQLERGKRLVELLKQNETKPQTVEDQMVSIYLAGEGEFDTVPVEDVRRFEAELLDHLHANASGVYDQIAGGQAFSDESQQTLKKSVEEFKRGFQTTDGSSVINEPEPEALAEEDHAKSQITVSRKSK
ncbi:F0F1 ATP synthase subunit alpha [Corynebacterium sp. 320]|uniref:ATP synthase subunit alpha n=1 Tax=Corynebacterium zhongnanshanii TaxID=2768834 RepID=A0ABQ6VGW5_9CORY|nr:MULTISPECIES: F0F1 ATP synthase subunit alpha [Corynebacterium]KAB1504538.1 F0F1 ATP synthase subunit alpha [Corynebacterium sp. 320]KAB1553401.1 F0F1 ATP synthase subunit alpha [Corynebacterium sp. 321]KAB1554489.1 F0F1 ATP synthase subunit alpha [Corynebacterium sp. 319]KAB3523650.1 F0F1 ATP synthase subunit alpha [Corynebacterium zhongnanshanii]KAB3528674.1 F0F1 ATP synthase subunit alpha [Corynebacterium sp. 250]